MPIGTSLGAYYDTDFHHEAGIDTDPSVEEVVKPKETPTDAIVQPPAKMEDDIRRDKSRLYIPVQATRDTDPDYDMKGWQEANPDARMSPGQHYPDTFKLPNHITFSNESKYSNDQTPGGQWQKGDNKSWTFTPSAYNLSVHGPSELQAYFDKYEQGNKLNLDTAHGIAAKATEMAADALKRAKGTPPTTNKNVYPNDIEINTDPRVDGRITPEDIDTGIGIAMSAGSGVMRPVTNMEQAIARVSRQPSTIGGEASREELLRGASNEELQAKIQNYDQHVLHGPLGDVHEGVPNATLEGRRLGEEGRTPFDLDRRPADNFYNTQGMSASEAAQYYHHLHERGLVEEGDRFLDHFERHAARNELDVFDRHLDHLRDPDGLQAQYEHESLDSMQERWDREDAVMYNGIKEEIEKGKTLQEKGGMKLKQRPRDPWDASNFHELGFMNDDGLVGKLSVEERKNGKVLYVDIVKGLKPSRSLGGPTDPNVNTFGTKEIRQLAKLLKDQFPNAEEIAGFRVSGARLKWGGNANASMRIRPPKEESARKSIDQLQQEWEDSIGTNIGD